MRSEWGFVWACLCVCLLTLCDLSFVTATMVAEPAPGYTVYGALVTDVARSVEVEKAIRSLEKSFTNPPPRWATHATRNAMAEESLNELGIVDLTVAVEDAVGSTTSSTLKGARSAAEHLVQKGASCGQVATKQGNTEQSPGLESCGEEYAACHVACDDGHARFRPMAGTCHLVCSLVELQCKRCETNKAYAKSWIWLPLRLTHIAISWPWRRVTGTIHLVVAGAALVMAIALSVTNGIFTTTRAVVTFSTTFALASGKSLVPWLAHLAWAGVHVIISGIKVFACVLWDAAVFNLWTHEIVVLCLCVIILFKKITILETRLADTKEAADAERRDLYAQIAVMRGNAHNVDADNDDDNLQDRSQEDVQGAGGVVGAVNWGLDCVRGWGIRV